MSLKEYLDKLTQLRTGRVGTHERPHKPALLLAIISMAEAGHLKENRVAYDPELFSLFRKFVDVVKTRDDAVNMLDPFWRLRTDGLLDHKPEPGLEAAVEVQAGAPSLHHLQRLCSYSTLPADLHALLQEPAARQQLREAIIHRYFAPKVSELERVIREEQGISQYEQVLEGDAGSSRALPQNADDFVRDQAFRRVVLRAYDYRCSACGLRVILDDAALVEAAHLVPFAISRDDDPCNGIALCRNHHWAMDNDLIAPTQGLLWQVSAALDDRIEGQRDLVGLEGRSVILPRLGQYRPKAESLRWREDHLRSA